MRNPITKATFLAATLALALPLAAAVQRGGASLTVLVNGVPRPEYSSGGTVYIEALKGREYELEIRNPYPYRVAVALAVDGLNTIDARHTEAWNARKWVLEPYGRTVISGWQVDDSGARRFYFTGERRSYGAALGETENLGNIEAVFYKERTPYYRQPRTQPYEEGAPERQDAPYGRDNEGRSKDQAGAAPAPPAPKSAQPHGDSKAESQRSAPEPSLSDDYAATGMGGRTRHDVYRVAMDLDPRPVATLRLRYEFRPQLVKLGIVPRLERPLDRRERSTGFRDGYSPQPDRGGR